MALGMPRSGAGFISTARTIKFGPRHAHEGLIIEKSQSGRGFDRYRDRDSLGMDLRG